MWGIVQINCYLIFTDTVLVSHRDYVPDQNHDRDWQRSLSILLRLSNRSGELVVAEAVILLLEAIPLLPQSLNVAFLLSELLLEIADLVEFTGLSELGRLFATRRLVTREALDLIFETEGVQDHDVGSVEDEGEEKGEAAEVHITLSVELASLVVGAGGATHDSFALALGCG